MQNAHLTEEIGDWYLNDAIPYPKGVEMSLGLRIPKPFDPCPPPEQEDNFVDLHAGIEIVNNIDSSDSDSDDDEIIDDIVPNPPIELPLPPPVPPPNPPPSAPFEPDLPEDAGVDDYLDEVEGIDNSVVPDNHPDETIDLPPEDDETEYEDVPYPSIPPHVPEDGLNEDYEEPFHDCMQPDGDGFVYEDAPADTSWVRYNADRQIDVPAVDAILPNNCWWEHQRNNFIPRQDGDYNLPAKQMYDWLADVTPQGDDPLRCNANAWISKQFQDHVHGGQRPIQTNPDIMLFNNTDHDKRFPYDTPSNYWRQPDGNFAIGCGLIETLTQQIENLNHRVAIPIYISQFPPVKCQDPASYSSITIQVTFSVAYPNDADNPKEHKFNLITDESRNPQFPDPWRKGFNVFLAPYGADPRDHQSIFVETLMDNCRCDCLFKDFRGTEDKCNAEVPCEIDENTFWKPTPFGVGAHFTATFMPRVSRFRPGYSVLEFSSSKPVLIHSIRTPLSDHLVIIKKSPAMIMVEHGDVGGENPGAYTNVPIGLRDNRPFFRIGLPPLSLPKKYRIFKDVRGTLGRDAYLPVVSPNPEKALFDFWENPSVTFGGTDSFFFMTSRPGSLSREYPRSVQWLFDQHKYLLENDDLRGSNPDRFMKVYLSLTREPFYRHTASGYDYFDISAFDKATSLPGNVGNIYVGNEFMYDMFP